MIKDNTNSKDTSCPCNSSKQFSECCEPFIMGKILPETPEQLMRSRYTAYTKANIDYIFETMRDSALKESDRAESLKWAKSSKWLGLKVLASAISDTDSTEGEVKFEVVFTQNNTKQVLKEHARFKKYDNKWYYVGNVPVNDYGTPITQATSNKIGRNEACTCGSGKKYKKCCALTA